MLYGGVKLLNSNVVNNASNYVFIVGLGWECLPKPFQRAPLIAF